jgi:hypothetical protein
MNILWSFDKKRAPQSDKFVFNVSAGSIFGVEQSVQILNINTNDR